MYTVYAYIRRKCGKQYVLLILILLVPYLPGARERVYVEEKTTG